MKVRFAFVVALTAFLLSCFPTTSVNLPAAAQPSGSVAGTVVIPSVSNNQVVWNGIGNALVYVGSSLSTTTVAGGAYLLNNVPSGSYNVTAQYSSSGSTSHYAVYEYNTPQPTGILVVPSYVTLVQDLQVVPNSMASPNSSILYGKIYHSNKVTPYGGLTIYIRDVAYVNSNPFPYNVLGSTVTSADGSYAFQYDIDYRYLTLTTGTTVDMKYTNGSVFFLMDDFGIMHADAYTLYQ